MRGSRPCSTSLISLRVLKIVREAVLVIGTSSIVYPAAAIPQHAARSGAFVVEVNLEPTPLTALAGAFLSGPAAVIVPQLVGDVS